MANPGTVDAGHKLHSSHPRWEHFTGLLRRHRILTAVAVMLLGGWLIALAYGNSILRAQVEARINANLKGYTVRLPELSFHPLGFSLTLHELELIQQKHPQPPIAFIPRIDASVAWRDLLHARLVADFVIDSPAFHVNLAQLQSEAAEPTSVQDRGWQEAVESIYPLKINHFAIHDGKVTYIDKNARRPLTIEDLELDLKNIRNVRSPEETFPSDVSFSATIFGSGGIRADGKANFLSEPFASADVALELREIPLDDVKPVALHANLEVEKGVLNARGHATITPQKQNLKLEKATLDGIRVVYVHKPQTASAEAQRLDTVKDAAADVSNEARLLVEVEEMQIRDSRLGYRDEALSPGYQIFFADTDITVRNVSSQATTEPASLRVESKFMGTGLTRINSTFRPVNKTPEFDLSVQIAPTELRSLNDVLRSYGKFDVTHGRFSFYSELRAQDGQLTGYVKPLFTDMDVYDSEQDKDESTLHRIYEGAVGGIATLLQNRRSDDMATRAEVVGRLDAPNVRTWQVVLNLLRNAFIEAIRPGLEADKRSG